MNLLLSPCQAFVRGDHVQRPPELGDHALRPPELGDNALRTPELGDQALLPLLVSRDKPMSSDSESVEKPEGII